MFGLTSLGIVHTAISLAALGSGIWALTRDKEISTHNPLGRTYLVTTFLTAATALGIFQHGGFGPPHALAILTILALAAGCVAAFTGVLGRWSRYAQALCFSTTVLFHLIPGFTESLTRLPPGQPVLPGADAPEFGPIYGTLFVLYLIGMALQWWWIRGQVGKPLAAAPA